MDFIIEISALKKKRELLKKQIDGLDKTIESLEALSGGLPAVVKERSNTYTPPEETMRVIKYLMEVLQGGRTLSSDAIFAEMRDSGFVFPTRWKQKYYKRAIANTMSLNKKYFECAKVGETYFYSLKKERKVA